MKRMALFLLALFFIPSCGPTLPPKEKITLKLLNSFATQQKVENNLQVIGVGGAMPQKVQMVDLHFITKKQPTLQQARKLYVHVVETLLAQINSNSEIRPYLKDYPFTHHNISLLISFETESGRDAEPPFIALVGIANGRIFYSINNRETDLLETIHEEAYEEVLNIVGVNKNVGNF